MIAEVESKAKEIINAGQLSAMCKLLGIGEALMHGEFALKLDTHVYTNNTTVQLGIVKRELIWENNHTTGTRLGDKIVEASFDEFPGNSDVMIFTNVNVNKRYREHGLGKLFHGLRLDIAKASGVSAVMCTVRSDNPVERAILKHFDWHEMRSFVPYYHRSDNLAVEFWMKELV